MKKARNVLLALLCALLLIAGSVAGTLAYLTDTKEATNTFTVGKVKITLDEAPVNKETGKKEAGDRVTSYTDVLLVPGRVIDKDPTVHVEEGSEKCYLFVKITNGLAGIETNDDAAATIAAQIEANGWTELENGVYYRVVEKTAERDYVVFRTFTVDKDNTNDTLAGLSTRYLNITAYAVQFEGMADVNAAWNVVK